MEELKAKWKLSDLGNALKNVFVAILEGKLLLRLNIGRYYLHIVYAFFLMAMVIWISLAIDTTMMKVERNKSILHELTILQSEKTFEVASLSRRSTVDAQLKEMGSEVTEPTTPAKMLVR